MGVDRTRESLSIRNSLIRTFGPRASAEDKTRALDLELSLARLDPHESHDLFDQCAPRDHVNTPHPASPKLCGTCSMSTEERSVNASEAELGCVRRTLARTFQPVTQ